MSLYRFIDLQCFTSMYFHYQGFMKQKQNVMKLTLSQKVAWYVWQSSEPTLPQTVYSPHHSAHPHKYVHICISNKCSFDSFSAYKFCKVLNFHWSLESEVDQRGPRRQSLDYHGRSIKAISLCRLWDSVQLPRREVGSFLSTVVHSF